MGIGVNGCDGKYATYKRISGLRCSFGYIVESNMLNGEFMSIHFPITPQILLDFAISHKFTRPLHLFLTC